MVAPARPLFRPAPRSAMFFPLVVLVAVLPGLYALRNWDLNPPGPWWGLRALAVLDGRWLDQVPAAREIGPAIESQAFRAVAMQPPLYAWLAALSLGLSPGRAPLASVLPSYVAGALAVVLVYLHGRLWGSRGLGLAAAVLVGFNRDLLVQMQQATPATLGLLGALVALYGYGRHLPSSSAARGAWAALGGVGLGASLMAVPGFALACLPVVVLHQAYLAAGPAPAAPPVVPLPAASAVAPRSRWRRWRRALLGNASLTAGVVATALALLLAAPWHLWMLTTYGAEWLADLVAPPSFRAEPPGLLGRLLELCPATLPLGAYGAARSIRQALTAEADDRETTGGSFWVVWLAVAALAPGLWPAGPRASFDLLLLVPMDLLAARAMIELARRRAPVRALTALAPATALTVAWRASDGLRAAVGRVAAGAWPDSATALGLHLALDLLLVVVLATRGLVRWARRRDDRQRLVLGGFLIAVTAATAVAGLREVGFRHRETLDLLALRSIIVRRHQAQPFTVVAVVSPPSAPDGPPGRRGRDRDGNAGLLPGGRLRYVLRTALPGVPQAELTAAEDLRGLPPGRRLVILVGTTQRLPSALRAELGLEAIHPGRTGILDAFATALSEPLPAPPAFVPGGPDEGAPPD